MNKEKGKDNYSGEVRVREEKIFWDYDNKEIFQIDLKDVVVIGEHTNLDGPCFDDWFLGPWLG